MIALRKSAERGHFDHGWLDTYHTFSFADYYDPSHVGFRSLRVMNEDRVQPDTGFGTHPHRDMEIVTVVLAGTLTHRDSLGNGGEIRAGELQRITAGTGIQHSEFNASTSEPVHLYQIWIRPERKGLEPGYEQRTFDEAARRGTLQLVASHDGRDGSLTIHQDAAIFVASLEAGQSLEYPLAPGRHAWLQVAQGEVSLNGQPLAEGDGAAVSDEPSIAVSAIVPSAILLFDLG
jgi:redox-sensitive bicupin YhaK (pirin superfamily)